MHMSNETYDKLKFIAQILLPALGALYFGLTQWWPLPYGAEVVGTITVIDTFLGSILQISTDQYNKELDEATGKHLSSSKDANDIC